jgi:hypothetical protein
MVITDLQNYRSEMSNQINRLTRRGKTKKAYKVKKEQEFIRSTISELQNWR